MMRSLKRVALFSQKNGNWWGAVDFINFSGGVLIMIDVSASGGGVLFVDTSNLGVSGLRIGWSAAVPVDILTEPLLLMGLSTLGGTLNRSPVNSTPCTCHRIPLAHGLINLRWRAQYWLIVGKLVTLDYDSLSWFLVGYSNVTLACTIRTMFIKKITQRTVR